MIKEATLQRILNELQPYRRQIALKYMNKEGFVQIKIEKGFRLNTSSMQFVHGPFNKEAFIYLGDPQVVYSEGVEPFDAVAMYYAIYWEDTFEWLFLKEVIVYGKKSN